jgi:hypothetical protein
MTRTIISLSLEDKRWLHSVAKTEHVSMAEVIRRAIAKYRNTRQSVKSPSVEQVMKEAFGIWKKGDGLAYTNKLRDEWER